MRHLFLFMLSCISMFSTAQTVTEAQKQEALQTATKFCELLKRFGNGERTLTTQIYALCTGDGFCVYDDIGKNEESGLMTYLRTITSKYPGKFGIVCSDMKIDEVYYMPTFSTSKMFARISDNLPEAATMETTVLNQQGFSEVYIIISVNLSYTTINRSSHRYIIYNAISKKITSFTTSESPNILMLKGAQAYTKKEYTQCMNYVDKAVAFPSKKFSKKYQCYTLGMLSSMYSFNLDKTITYIENCISYLSITNTNATMASTKVTYDKDIYNLKMLLLTFKGMKAEKNKDYTTALKNYETVANSNVEGCEYALIQVAVMLSNGIGCDKNLQKAKSLLVKAAEELHSPQAAYMLAALNVNNPPKIDLTDEEYEKYVLQSAEAGYPPALLLAGLSYATVKNYASSCYWCKKSADAGNPIGMAWFGRYMAFADGEDRDVSLGISWLKNRLKDKNWKWHFKNT